MSKPSDTELLDWLQAQLDKGTYTGRACFRWSTTGRGWRLHETSWEGAVPNVRIAIANGMEHKPADEIDAATGDKT